MEKERERSAGQKKPRKKKKAPAVICSLTGILLLIGVILVCIPLTVPRLLGYEVYNVISGSMEPAILTGSLVYVKEAEPSEVQEEDIIAFYSASNTGAIITHRVVKNQVVSGQFITKGDANEEADPLPIDYDLLIGKVVLSVPMLGEILSFIVTTEGKIAAFAIVVLAVLLQFIADKLK